MKIIGLIIAMTLVVLLFVWWMTQYTSSMSRSMEITRQIESDQNSQVQPGTGPIEYSQQKVDEINQLNQDQAKELDLLQK